MRRAPPVEDALVAGLPVGVVGLDGEAGVDREIQTGFVLEVDANAVIAQFGRELYFLNDFVFGLGKVDDFSKPSAELFAVVSAGRLRPADGAFSFCSSHVCLPRTGDVVRAMSVLQALACAR